MRENRFSLSLVPAFSEIRDTQIGALNKKKKKKTD